MPQPHLTPRKDPVPILQEAGWASEPVWSGVENLASTGIRSPDRPARRQLLYWLRYPAHVLVKYMGDIKMFKIFLILKIHVLYHLMTIFPGKKMLNLCWESCLNTTKKYNQINYKIVILFICGKSSKLFQRWEWIFGFHKMQEIFWLAKEPQEGFCCVLWEWGFWFRFNWDSSESSWLSLAICPFQNI